MNMNKIVVALGLSMSLVAGSAMAAGEGNGTVTFKGAIVDAPCSIEPGSVDQTVELGQISNLALKDGGRSTPRPFQIKLENCDTATNKEVTVTFAGTGSQVIPGKLAITGTASGAAIGINFGDTEIELGTATPAQKLMDGNNQLSFAAFLQGGGASETIVPGEFQSVADFALNYQ